jgi:P22 coat protein - gene protein 5
MANSITGVNDDIISQSVLSGFIKSIAPIMAFATDFSSDAAKKGDKVSVLRDNTAIDAAADKTTHAAYTIQDADSDAIEISLGQPKYVSWGLDDTEIAQSSVVNLEVYGRRKGNKLASTILADILSPITAANFGAAAFTGAASTFDADDVADIKSAADAADWDDMSRYLVLSPTYYNALLKDAGIQSADAFGGIEAIRAGKIPTLFGFGLIMSNLIPANGENLVGFASCGSGLATAFRYLQPQEGNTYNRAERLTDPSGMTLGLRDWYSNDTGVRNRVVECVYGKAVGIPTGILRMVSA